jgi:sugar phosphate isomerase/epimerase
MQAGIFAKTFAAQGAAENFKAVRRAGYTTVHFNLSCVGLAPMPDEITNDVTQSIAEASRAAGVSLAGVSATYNMIHPDEAQRRDGMRRLGVMIAAARSMGTKFVTLCTGTRDPQDQWRFHPDNQSSDAWRDLLVEMESAVGMAEAHSIDLGIEPELANIVNSADAAQRLINDLASQRLRIVLDPANLFEVAGDTQQRDIIARSVDLLGDCIAMAHAKDRDAKGGFVAAGSGVIDFRHFIGRLKANGFDGPLVTHGLSEAEAPQVAHFLQEIIGS